MKTMEFPGLCVAVKRNPRARRLVLRVKPEEVSVTVPPGAADADVMRFVFGRRRWIEGKLDFFRSLDGPRPCVNPVHGDTVWLFGEPCDLVAVNGDSSPFMRGREIICGENRLGTRLHHWLDERLLEEVTRFAEAASSLCPSRIRLGNAVSRWGSCSRAGVVMLNRRLVHAPSFVVEYVTLHELVHLRHRNHSRGFHKDLKALGADTEGARKWLRTQGLLLL